MLERFQKTLKTPVTATGIGLHSGKRIQMRLLPTPANSGIVFVRTDCAPAVEIPVAPASVGDTRMASTLTAQGVKVSTVEHLMSACYGLGLDCLRIELDGEEIPIMDGSAATFAYLLQSGGIEALSELKRYIEITAPIEVREGEGKTLKWARLLPYKGFKLSFEIEFDHPAIDSTGRVAEFDFNTEQYLEEIARARTFGFTHQVEMLRDNGFALGGSLDNAIVMDEYRILNDGGLRYEDEFAKHKILDAVGDLYLAGLPLLGSYQAYKSGHDLNNKLLRKVLASPESMRIVTL